MEELKELYCLLEERLVQHDNNRKEVQSQVDEICSNALKEADLLEENISKKGRELFNEKDKLVIALIEDLRNSNKHESKGAEGGDELKMLLDVAKDGLAYDQKFEIQVVDSAGSFSASRTLSVLSIKTEHDIEFGGIDAVESAISKLQENAFRFQESFVLMEKKLEEICDERRREANELKTKINEKLEPIFSKEDARVQEVTNLVRKNIGGNGTPEEMDELIRRVRTILLNTQKYVLTKQSEDKLSLEYDITITNEISLKNINFEEREPTNFAVSFSYDGGVVLYFSFFMDNEKSILESQKVPFDVIVSGWEKGRSEDSAKTYTSPYSLESKKHIIIYDGFQANTTYCFKMKIGHENLCTKWSETVEITTPGFKEFCVWKKITEGDKKHFVDENNPRIVSGNSYYFGGSTFSVTNTPLPINKVISCNFTILKSDWRKGIMVGVAPFDTDFDTFNNNYYEIGWYFNCEFCALYSGFPHNYKYKEYVPKKLVKKLGRAHKVDAVMDTMYGILSFSIDGKNYGPAYEGVPLDKPLAPCAIFCCSEDTIEIKVLDVKDPATKTPISAPSGIVTKWGNTWDSIDLTWDRVRKASFYQIEVDGSILLDASLTNEFTKKGLLAGTEHSFRVRAVNENEVSEWSDVVKERTGDAFEHSWWKGPQEDLDSNKMYYVNQDNPRIITRIGSRHNSETAIIGNANIPLNKVLSWGIKILKTKYEGFGIYIGVAPSDINRNGESISTTCGWYFDCESAKLLSGPPHNYRDKEYGPKREKGKYVHTGDTVGVEMDTTKGELSFMLKGVNLGVAYEGIPLDKPLVPCVIIRRYKDSVELVFSGTKKSSGSLIHPPSNVEIKCESWDSIILTWKKIRLASLYQIEVDGNKSLHYSETNFFTLKSLSPDTEHTFRVRGMKEKAEGEWSAVVKGRTQKILDFSEFKWKECPESVEKSFKYSVDEKNARISTKSSETGYYSSIIGGIPFPKNRVTSWNIKILKSKGNDGSGIFIGVVPFDITQNEGDYSVDHGWYFNCYCSKLYSGPPHSRPGKPYGPSGKENGEFIHTGDSVGVAMDTTRGDLSFVIDGINYGNAYEGIPLDKPLVPSVVLYHKGDSVELDPSEAKENAGDSSIHAPTGLTAKSEAWDSVILTWDPVIGASHYQIEVDGSKTLCNTSVKPIIIRKELHPDSEHTFRVRTVKDDSVSEWSDLIKERTLKTSDFSESVWKKFSDQNLFMMARPGYAEYSVDNENPRITTNACSGYFNIFGSVPLPLNKEVSWSVKILKSKDNDGNKISVGVAPFDLNHDVSDDYKKTGWYFDCYGSTLHSGPPHNFKSKEYGPRKEDGKYIHTGDTIGVVVDTTKGELSFVLNGANLGVAYEEIPLDRPLLPCVVPYFKGDSFELII